MFSSNPWYKYNSVKCPSHFGCISLFFKCLSRNVSPAKNATNAAEVFSGINNCVPNRDNYHFKVKSGRYEPNSADRTVKSFCFKLTRWCSAL